jgi:16S rRNA processing protein RimM
LNLTKYRIGIAARPVGLKGELTVRPDTFDIQRYFDLTSVFIGPTEHQSVEYQLEQARVHGNRLVIKVRGIDSRIEAEKLNGCYLYVDEEHRIDLPEGKHFIHDLIGLQAVDESGESLGLVKEVLPMPAHPVYVIENATGEHMVPALDEFIIRIDIAAGKIVIRPIEGLFE